MSSIIKVREEVVESRGALIAIGVNERGSREIFGVRAVVSESEKSWDEFFRSLKKEA